MNLSDFASEIIDLIIDKDYEVYRGFLAFPWFARQLTPNTIVDWAITCGVDVHITIDATRWTLRGQLHRSGDMPAIEQLLPYQGIIKQWYYGGVPYHKHDKATYEENAHGQIISKWLTENGLHRYDGPAFTIIYLGTTLLESWYLFDKKHRYSGPSKRECLCDEIDQVIGERSVYYIHGTHLSFDEYYDAIGEPNYLRPIDNSISYFD